MLKTRQHDLIEHTAKVTIKGTEICRYVGITVSEDTPYSSIIKHLGFIADDLKKEYHLPQDMQFEVTLY